MIAAMVGCAATALCLAVAVAMIGGEHLQTALRRRDYDDEGES